MCLIIAGQHNGSVAFTNECLNILEPELKIIHMPSLGCEEIPKLYRL